MKVEDLVILDELYSAYDNLQVLCGANNCDSGNVGYVLVVLNKHFETVLTDFQNIKVKGGVHLKSVN